MEIYERRHVRGDGKGGKVSLPIVHCALIFLSSPIPHSLS